MWSNLLCSHLLASCLGRGRNNVLVLASGRCLNALKEALDSGREPECTRILALHTVDKGAERTEKLVRRRRRQKALAAADMAVELLGFENGGRRGRIYAKKVNRPRAPITTQKLSFLATRDAEVIVTVILYSRESVGVRLNSQAVAAREAEGSDSEQRSCEDRYR